MSFREKSAWISLLTCGGVYGYYFWTLSRVIAAGNAATFAYGGLLVRSMFLLVVIEVALQIALALRAPREALSSCSVSTRPERSRLAPSSAEGRQMPMEDADRAARSPARSPSRRPGWRGCSRSLAGGRTARPRT